MSLDGYIAGPNGEYDWIIMDPAIDFRALFAQFDVLLMGLRRPLRSCQPDVRRCHARSACDRLLTNSQGCRLSWRDHRRRCRCGGCPAQEPGRERHLVMGRRALFQSLLEARLVDTVEIGLIPVLLGGGVPMLPPPCRKVKLELTSSKALSTGIVMLTYNVAF